MIGSRLQDLRNSKKLSRKSIAQQLNIHESTYGKYELGKRAPDNETIIKLADFFEVSTDYLLGNTDDPTPGNKKSPPTFAQVEEAYVAMLLRKKGVEKVEDIELTEKEMEELRNSFTRLIKGYLSDREQ